MMNIIESIGSWGVNSTSTTRFRERCQRPRSGDIVEFTDTEYPHTQGKYGRIEGLGTWKEGEYHICCGLGSAFLCENGHVSICGGPFESVLPEELIPTYDTFRAEYWNWGNNSPGANQGVYYYFHRPVFRLIRKKKNGGEK
jgi:hypothetical protein